MKSFVLPQRSLLQQQVLDVLPTGRLRILVKLHALLILKKHRSTWLTII